MGQSHVQGSDELWIDKNYQKKNLLWIQIAVFNSQISLCKLEHRSYVSSKTEHINNKLYFIEID